MHATLITNVISAAQTQPAWARRSVLPYTFVGITHSSQADLSYMDSHCCLLFIPIHNMHI